MLTPQKSRPRLYGLLAALCILPPLAFVASLPWLKQQPDDLVFLITGITAAIVILGSLALDVLVDRRLDEWQRSNARFSLKWGWAVGLSVIALLLALPPFQDLLVHWAAIWGDVPDPDRRLVIVTFTAGFVAVVVAQTVFTTLASIGWAYWKSRDPS